jgi:hypothetical protein
MSIELKSDKDLFDFLVFLSKQFYSYGQNDIANELNFASRFASGSTSEFYHESEIVLKRVRDSFKDLLTESQFLEIISVIDQIDSAFKRIGGA